MPGAGTRKHRRRPGVTRTRHYPPPRSKFDYVLRVTEHPCKPRIPQSNKAAKTLKVGAKAGCTLDVSVQGACTCI